MKGPTLRYPASETAEKHEKIVRQAARLFRQGGLSGVVIDDIMKGADLTHGSFYNHFASKQGLISECVAYIGATALAQMQAHESSVAGRDAFVSQYLSLAARDDPGAACLMSSLAAEIARQPPLRRSMTGYVQSFIGKLASHFHGQRKLTRGAMRSGRWLPWSAPSCSPAQSMTRRCPRKSFEKSHRAWHPPFTE